jgi:hypothetical protein
MKEHEINKLDNFICGWYADDTSFCDELIEYYHNNDKVEGKVGFRVDKNVKDSIECSLLPGEEMWRRYVGDFLQPFTNEYIKKYPYCNMYSPWRAIEGVNVQCYNPNSAFYGWHSERTISKHPMVSRHLVFMTYLNDVTDGGETEFLYQKIKVKPEKGLTLIWNSDWTFTHRGIPSKTQQKFITTGWYNYIDID